MTIVNSQKFRREFLAMSEDLFGRSVDATLSVLAFLAALGVPQSKSSGTLRAQIATDRFLHGVNYDVIKNALITAWKRRYIQRHRHALPQITKEGKRRLTEVLPMYNEKRTWDGRLHLITYDIPEAKKKSRDILRYYLRRIKCANLQESVWITPYNPVDLFRVFAKENGISGTVIISDLGADASIGEETLLGLIIRLYNLEVINGRYKEWFYEYKGLAAKAIGYGGLVRYLAILKDDPQLPFVLLPKWWMGEKAYQTIKPLLGKLSLVSRPGT